MMIIDPVTLGDVSCTRASVKYVFDRTGTLVQVPANTLAVTYDPSDLTKAPYALVEAASANYTTGSDALGTGWFSNGGSLGLGGYPCPRGDSDVAASRWSLNTYGQGKFFGIGGPTWVAGTQYVLSVFVRYVSGIGRLMLAVETQQLVIFDPVTSTISSNSAGSQAGVQLFQNGWARIWVSGTADAASSRAVTVYAADNAPLVIDVFGSQFEPGSRPSSYIPTAGAPVTRAADVIAPGAGLVYSNVAITEAPYNSASTYAKDAQVYDPATYLMYQSLVANNTGHALSDTASWTPLLKVVNRRLMLDQYNNTQTANAEEIVIVLSPQAIAQGLYLGNVDASEIRISSVDPVDGLVYQEVQSQVISNSASSWFNWFFKRIKRRSYAVSVLLPPYLNALVTIAIKKPGGIPKCGMCALGSLVDVGLSQYGLSREIKDYSTVNFNFDGTSNVVLRNYAKIMDVDVILQNDQIDSVIDELEAYRQKPVVWIGAVQYGSACLFGTYTSFKNVVAYPNESTMNLQIQGTV